MIIIVYADIYINIYILKLLIFPSLSLFLPLHLFLFLKSQYNLKIFKKKSDIDGTK